MKHVICSLLLVVAPFALLGACKTAPTTGYQHFNVDLDKHLTQVGLGPGDVFEVRVYNEAALSGVHQIEEDGSFEFPLVGRVDANGKTVRAIGSLITERLKDGYLGAPSVKQVLPD